MLLKFAICIIKEKFMFFNNDIRYEKIKRNKISENINNSIISFKLHGHSMERELYPGLQLF